MDPALRLQPGQAELTSAQKAEVRRFAEAFIQTQLSTEPVDEQQAEVFLRQAYEAAGLAPPQRIHWLDGPLQLVAVLAPPSAWDSLPANVWVSLKASDKASIRTSLWDRVEDSVKRSIWDSIRGHTRDHVWAYISANVWAGIETRIKNNVWASVSDSIRESIEARIRNNVRTSYAPSIRTGAWDRIWATIWNDIWDSIKESVRAYDNAPLLAVYHFFDTYLTPNRFHALAHFNELVSGYWAGKEQAVIVRRPAVLLRDVEGRLHSASSKAIEYPDGWGFYAWHGVRVPEKVILAPEKLTRRDWSKARNVEVRRVMQERMGQRFVPELGGMVIDSGPHGTLYEVALPRGEPERVARYVQVQDASTPRQYFLRVPPTIQTAAEAVAWSFGLSVEAYHPAQET